MGTPVRREASSVTTGQNGGKKYVEWAWENNSLDGFKDKEGDSFDIDFKIDMSDSSGQPVDTSALCTVTAEQTDGPLYQVFKNQVQNGVNVNKTFMDRKWKTKPVPGLGCGLHRRSFDPDKVQKIKLNVLNKFGNPIDHFAENAQTTDSGVGFIQPIVQIDLQAMADSEIQAFPPPAQNQNFGGNLSVILKSGQEYRLPMKFDLSSIGSVTSAILELNVLSTSGTSSIDAFLLLESWQENGVTWKHRDYTSNQFWTILGGTNNNQSIIASGPVAVNGTGKISLDLTSYVQQILSGTANHGILLRNVSSTPNSIVEVSSREAADPALRPVLKIMP